MDPKNNASKRSTKPHNSDIAIHTFNPDEKIQIVSDLSLKSCALNKRILNARSEKKISGHFI